MRHLARSVLRRQCSCSTRHSGYPLMSLAGLCEPECAAHAISMSLNQATGIQNGMRASDGLATVAEASSRRPLLTCRRRGNCEDAERLAPLLHGHAQLLPPSFTLRTQRASRMKRSVKTAKECQRTGYRNCPQRPGKVRAHKFWVQ